MNEKIKVSVIVAVYKSEKFLAKLLDSLVAQTYKNIEVILVDDGSPDDSGAICDKYASIDSRFSVIHKSNGGACDARNAGLNTVTGQYVTIIDGDDWLENDYIEYLLSMALEYSADMSMSENIFTTRDRKQISQDYIRVYSNDKAATDIIYQKIPVGPWNKLYKTEMIKKNGLSFSVPWSGEGLYFSCMAAQYSNRVVVGKRKVYNYRLNNTNSGLTHYNVRMGTNSIKNVRYIGRVSIVNSKQYRRSLEWHLWANYYYILFLIIATDSCTENNCLYADCISNIRRRLISVLIHSDFSLKAKIKMLLQGLFPVKCACMELNKSRRALAADKME